MPLDAIDPTFINAPGGVGPSYDAEELRRDIGGLLAGGATAASSRSGVLDPRGLMVTLSGNNAQVIPGPAAVDAGKGAYLTGAKTTATIDTLKPADATNPRRDRVVLEILDPDGGGGAGRKGQFRVITGEPQPTAASGGGFPAAPASPSITLAHIDVPKVGGGNPTVTDLRPFTAAAGGVIPVRNKAERDLLPKWNGGICSRLDRGGAIEICNGTSWWALPAFDFGQGQSELPPVMVSRFTSFTAGAFGDFTITLPTPFATTLVAAHVQEASPIGNNDYPVIIKVRMDSSDRTKIVGRCYRGDNTKFVGSINVTYTASGY